MSDSPPESASSPPPGWLERGLEHLQDLGLSPNIAERFVSWWRRYGLAKTMVLAMAVLWPVLRFEVLPGATSAALESMAEGEGLQLEVGDWSLSLTNFSATAHDVVIRTDGGYRQPFVLKAETVQIDASLFQNIQEGVGRWRRRVANMGRWLVGRDTVAQPPVPIGRSLTISGAELYIERLISGRYNWQDAIVRTSAREPDDSDAGERYFVPVITVKDFEVSFVEHLPAPVGSGLEQSLTSTFHLDEGTVRLADFVGPTDTRDDPTDFMIDGRVADGRLSATGAFNLWAPSFALDIALTNVGAATLGLLTPEASLLPASGALTGHIKVAMRGDQMRECAVNMTFHDVRYRPNPRSPIVAPRQRAVAQQLQDVVLTEVVQTTCHGDWDDPRFRPHWSVQASMTAGALEDASPDLQSVAQFDQKRFSEALTPQALQAEVSRSLDAFTNEVGRQIGDQTGNAVSRGLKNVGRGVGRLFGRKPQ